MFIYLYIYIYIYIYIYKNHNVTMFNNDINYTHTIS